MICRVLVYSYFYQNINVKWGDTTSINVKVNNGVRQGGILSPYLFSVYIDVLLQNLKDSGFGCHIGDTFMGTVSYADDVVILAPSLTSLKQMLNICDKFSDNYNVLFNVDKYQLLHCTNDKETVDGLYYQGVYIKCSTSAVHLGHVLTAKNDTQIYTYGLIQGFYQFCVKIFLLIISYLSE